MKRFAWILFVALVSPNLNLYAGQPCRPALAAVPPAPQVQVSVEVTAVRPRFTHWKPQAALNRSYAVFEYDLQTTRIDDQGTRVTTTVSTVPKYQYVIYSPDDPNWVYWYNPVAKVFWARCPTPQNPERAKLEAAGTHWCVLEKDRPADFAGAVLAPFFKPFQPAPSIPEATDGARFLDPPDLPR